MNNEKIKSISGELGVILIVKSNNYLKIRCKTSLEETSKIAFEDDSEKL